MAFSVKSELRSASCALIGQSKFGINFLSASHIATYNPLRAIFHSQPSGNHRVIELSSAKDFCVKCRPTSKTMLLSAISCI